MANRRRKMTGPPPELTAGNTPPSTAQPPEPRAPEVTEPVTPREGYVDAAKEAARDDLAEQETHMEEIAETGVPYIGPPPITTAPTVHTEEFSRLGGPQGTPGNPPAPKTGGDLAPEPPTRSRRKKSHARLTPEGLEADPNRSPGERIRRRAAH